MIAIELTQGKRAIIDDEDYELVSKYKWHFDGRYAAHKGRKKIYMHRLIMGKSPLDVDHINRDKLDNRRKNLRFCTRSQNLLNKKVKGVYSSKLHSNWEVRVGSKYYGQFASRKEALGIRKKIVSELMGSEA